MTNLDLVLATTIALGLPFATAWLLDVTGGALLGLVLYYVVCCVGVVWWRKGTLDYRWPERWPWRLFTASLLIPLAITWQNWNALPQYNAALFGFAVTVLVWSPLNGAMEQLVWQYVLDAWRNRWPSGAMRWFGTAIGVVLLVTLVGLIHALFWGQFLPIADSTPVPGLSIVLNLLLTASYVALYYRSRSMWPTFVIHLLVDLQFVILARYSILPDL